jgi:iron complex outermembrane receptor protein
VTNYELGLKSDWMDSRVRVNAAIFYMEYDDAQINQFKAGAGGASSIVSNAGELEIKGGELELTAQLTEGLRLMLNYGYTDAEYKEYITGRVDPITALADPSDAADADGNENVADVAIVPRTPKHNGALILSYDFQPFSFGQLNIRADATYRDEMVFESQLNYYNSTEEQTLLNARATLSQMEVLGGNLLVAAWGTNLTDEQYREWGIDFTTLGFAIDSFKEGRAYGLDITYEFGR